MKRNEKTERNRRIYKCRKDGCTYRMIAKCAGISICRVKLKDTVFISDEPRYCFEMTEIIEANKAANQKSKREEAADDREQ